MEMVYTTLLIKKKNKHNKKNMKYKFIQVNNDLNKAEAFANTLNNSNILNVQNIIQPQSYIKTIDVIERFQSEGWVLKGVSEQRDKKSRKKFYFSRNCRINRSIHWFVWYSLGNNELISIDSNF